MLVVERIEVVCGRIKAKGMPNGRLSTLRRAVINTLAITRRREHEWWLNAQSSTSLRPCRMPLDSEGTKLDLNAGVVVFSMKSIASWNLPCTQLRYVRELHRITRLAWPAWRVPPRYAVLEGYPYTLGTST